MARRRSASSWAPRILAISIGAFLATVTSLRRLPSPREADVKQDAELSSHGRHDVGHLQAARDKYPVEPEVAAELRGASSGSVTPRAVVNPHPYGYILTPDGICRGQPLAVVFVHSAPSHGHRREMIRNTWGNSSYQGNGKLAVIFAIGSSLDEQTRRAIQREHAVYKDVLSENYIDDYRNLTIKAVGALRWILKNCLRAKFVIKTDDDTLMNVFSVLRHLSDLNRTGQTSGMFMCRRNRHFPVLRSGRWRVTYEEYPEEHFPPYCAGLAYILTMDVAKRLYEASFQTPVLWIDDVWLTGLVAERARIQLTNIGHVYSLNKTEAEQLFVGDRWYQYLFAHLGPRAFVNIWKQIVALATKREIPPSGHVVPGRVVNR